jgi:tetratricopeptide (TPR) repeat protein
MNVLGILSAYLRQFERAERYLRGSLQIAESLADPIGIQYASLNLSLFHYVRPGELQACLAFLDEQASKAQAWADERLPAMLLLLKTRALMALGQYLPALSGAERALAILHTKGLARTDEAYARLRLGHAQSWLGRYDEARRNLQSAAAVARESRDESLLGHALMWEAEAALNEGEPETMAAALGLVDEALSAFREGFEDAERALAYAVGARLHLALGELGEARAWSRRAVDSMADHPAPIEPEQVYFTHHRALRALGREAEADEYLQRAYERVMLVADKTPDPELRRSWLENVEANRQIVEAWAARGGP